MIDSVKIMNTIVKLVAEQVLEIKHTYIDIMPTDFIRPCLLIQPVKDISSAINAVLLQTDAYFTLTVYDETNDYTQSDTCRLLNLRQKVLDLFRCGYLTVEDRAIQVEVSAAGRELDKAYIDIQFTYHEDLRNESQDSIPLMEKVETKIKVKGKGE